MVTNDSMKCKPPPARRALDGKSDIEPVPEYPDRQDHSEFPPVEGAETREGVTPDREPNNQASICMCLAVRGHLTLGPTRAQTHLSTLLLLTTRHLRPREAPLHCPRRGVPATCRSAIRQRPAEGLLPLSSNLGIEIHRFDLLSPFAYATHDH